MAVSFTDVLQISDNLITDSGVSKTYSTYVGAGLIEGISLQFSGTTVAEICDGDFSNLISKVTTRFGGNQNMNLVANVTGSTETTVGRLTAIAQSVGGYCGGDMSATGYAYELYIPMGIYVGGQTRFEIDLTTVAGGETPTAQDARIVFKYGSSASATIYGNPSTFNVTTGQVMAQVPIGNWGKGAKVIGLAIQEPQNSDKLTQIVCKPLGDFQASPAVWRARAGVLGGNQYYFPDADGDNPYTFANQLGGFHYIPTYSLDVSATGNVTLLLTASESLSNVQILPIIQLPTSGNGELKAVQTASVKTSGADASVMRAEE